MYEDDSAVIPYIMQISSLYVLPKSFYRYRIGRVGSICNTPQKFENYYRDAVNLCRYYAENRERLGFSERTLDCYYYHYLMDRLWHAVLNKQDALADKITKDERFSALLNEQKGFKYALLRRRKYGLYRFLLNCINLFRNH